MVTITMKRGEWWRFGYRLRRDLDHLSAEDLSERLNDCIENIRVRTEQGKLGFLPVNEPIGEAWLIRTTEVLEECDLRNYGHPGPISLAKYRPALDHAFDPIPDMDRVFDEYGLRGKSYLLKFGEPKWLGQSLELGKFRIASASYYDSAEHNFARRDTELRRFVLPNPRAAQRLNLNEFARSAGGWASVSSRTDYLLYSLSGSYTSRLFGDFAATSCLVIFEPEEFLRRMVHALERRLPNWDVRLTEVNYYDPVRVDPRLIAVHLSKPFRHSYQDEQRLICIPPEPVSRLEPLEIEIGSLADCATLVHQ